MAENKKVTINLNKTFGKVFKASDGRLYVDVEDLFNRCGFEANNGDKIISFDVLLRKQPGQYGETHSVKAYDKNLKKAEYVNGISVKDLVFGDGNSSNNSGSNQQSDIFNPPF